MEDTWRNRKRLRVQKDKEIIDLFVPQTTLNLIVAQYVTALFPSVATLSDDETAECLTDCLSSDVVSPLFIESPFEQTRKIGRGGGEIKYRGWG